jgi:hypothetical protein
MKYYLFVAVLVLIISCEGENSEKIEGEATKIVLTKVDGNDFIKYKYNDLGQLVEALNLLENKSTKYFWEDGKLKNIENSVSYKDYELIYEGEELIEYI